MKKQQDFVKALEVEAIEQLELIRAYRVYQGANPDYKHRAKMAIGVIGAYVRLCATVENARTNDLVELRLLGPMKGDEAPAGTLKKLMPASPAVMSGVAATTK